ncbi:FHA domain-containing protein [Pseudoroseomonas wenyumeiae]
MLRVEGAGEAPALFEAEGGATIGRTGENDLVLPDDSRTISKRHCELALLDGRFRLIDHSRNGTFLNDAAEPVGPAAAVPVSAGDVIRLGEVRITVVAATASAEPLPPGGPWPAGTRPPPPRRCRSPRKSPRCFRPRNPARCHRLNPPPSPTTCRRRPASSCNPA